LTSIQHRKALRWAGHQGDITLTPDSSAWLDRWLSSHSVSIDRPVLQHTESP
jgi:hypothetical protein